LEPVPEENRDLGPGNREQGSDLPQESAATLPSASARKAARTMLEARMEGVIGDLAPQEDPPSATVRQGHLALLKRWYYRPEAKRTGEVFFPDAEGDWPVKAILRGVGRIAAKALTASQPS